MLEYSAEQVLHLLGTGRPSDLVGAHESVTVDFKAEPYIVELAAKKQELAKDVSSFANVAGGVIAIGFKTEKESGRATDVITDLRPFAKELLNEEQLRKVLADWVYPPLMGLRFDWHVVDSARGYLTILIPEQPRSNKPFVVRRTVSTNAKIDGAIFGVFERRHADSQPYSAEEVQSVLRDGLIFRAALDSRAAGATEILGSTAPPAHVPPVTAEATIKKAAKLTDLMGLAQLPTYVLTATPHPALLAASMFEAADNAVVKLLNNPPQIRESGFDMHTGSPAEIVGGQSRRSLVEAYKGKELWRDGTLVFVARADDDFLCWGNRDMDAPFIVNPVTLTESVLLFCRLAAAIYEAIDAATGAVEFAIHLRRMPTGDEPTILLPGPASSRRSRFSAKQAPARDFDATETVRIPFQPETVAYRIVSRVYEWFGFEHDQIPYTGRGSIDATAIARI